MKWITILFALFILLIILWVNTGSMPRGLIEIYDFPGGDKAGHFILFGTLSYLLNLTTTSRLEKSPAKTIITVTFILLLLVGLEEWTQQFLSNRTASWIDLVFSYSGIMVGAWLAWFSRKKAKNDQPPTSPQDQ